MSGFPEHECADLERRLRHLDEATLIAMLTVVQARLGTDREDARDLTRARAIAHRLSNLRMFRTAPNGGRLLF